MKKCGGMASVRKLAASSQGAVVVTPPTIIPQLAFVVANEASVVGDFASEVSIEAPASLATPPTIVTPTVVGNEATTSIGDIASMGADDDVHFVDDGGYLIAEA